MSDVPVEAGVPPQKQEEAQSPTNRATCAEVERSLMALRLEVPEAVWDHHAGIVRAALTAATTCNCLVRESVDRCPVHLPAAYKTTRAALTAAERELDHATQSCVRERLRMHEERQRAEAAEAALVEEREAHRHTKRLLEASEAQNASDAGGES